MAFTDYETEQLRKALLKETRHCAVTLGMKKTSVDQLTKAVGIAKGSFYKFYESKEMLFFAVLENVHSELYGVADHALSEANGLPPSERAAEAVLAVCRRLSDTGDMVFIENDAKLLLQRLPEDVKNIHYHDDETHIRQLLEKAGIPFVERDAEQYLQEATALGLTHAPSLVVQANPPIIYVGVARIKEFLEQA